MSNLLQKASIITTPTAYENGKILSVKPVQSLGVEQIENGNFATDSDWTKGTGWTISGGTANATSAATGTPLSQYIDTGKKYKITYDVVSLSQGAFQIDLSYSGTALGQLVTTTGTFTDIVTSINPALSIRVVGTTTGSIDNVSVKELIDADFNFTRNSSATRTNSQGLIEDMQILSADLVTNGDFSQIGSELITNGNFDTNLSDWINSSSLPWTSATWTTSGVRLQTSGTAEYKSFFQYIGPITLGKTYKITYNAVKTSGIMRVGIETSPVGSSIGYQNTLSSSEVVNDFFTATATNSNAVISFWGQNVSETNDWTIDNVSVKEVGQDWSVTDSDANNYVEFNGSTARLKFLNTSPVTQLTTSFVMTAGKKYKLTVDVATVTSGGIKVDGNGISETFNTSGITTRIINPTGASAINFYRATANVDITLNSVSLIEITEDTNLPRIDYTGGVGHWLFEPQSTNLIPYSEDFTQSTWGKQSGGVASAPVVTSNYSISPDGTLNADRVVLNVNGGTTSSDFSQLAESVTSNVGDVTNSVWLKSNTSSNYDMTFVNALGSTISIAVTTEWKRFILTSTTTTTSSVFKLRLRGSESTNDFADVSVWGAQIEQQSYATSYIPTSGSQVTRLQDAAFGAGSSDLINSTEGVLYLESKSAIETTSVYNYYIALSDGTSSNRFEIRQTAANLQFLWRVGGAYQGQLISSGIQLTNFNKIALKYSSTEISYWINGNEIGTISTPTLFSANTLTELAFDDGAGSNKWMGKTKCVAVFKEALTDAELTCLTTI